MTQKQIAAIERRKQMDAAYKKLAEAKRLHRNRRAATLHREYYRMKHGILIDAPVLTPAESTAIARKARLEKRKETTP